MIITTRFNEDEAVYYVMDMLDNPRIETGVVFAINTQTICDDTDIRYMFEGGITVNELHVCATREEAEMLIKTTEAAR